MVWLAISAVGKNPLAFAVSGIGAEKGAHHGGIDLNHSSGIADRFQPICARD
jgi:hypothetical protein